MSKVFSIRYLPVEKIALFRLVSESIHLANGFDAMISDNQFCVVMSLTTRYLQDTMTRIIRLCIWTDLAAVAFLLIAALQSGQDIAGKAMVVLPVFHLVFFVALALFLLRMHFKIWALIMSALPAAVVAYLLFISFI